MTFFYVLIVLGFIGICYIAWECRQAMPEPAVGVGALPEPVALPPTGLLIVRRGDHIEDMRFMTGPVPELRLPTGAPDVCPICHRPDCNSALANCLERWR